MVDLKAVLCDDILNEITVNTVRQQFNIPDGAYVDNVGYLVQPVKYDGHSSYTEIKKIRVATQEDRCAVLVINRIAS